MRICLSLPQQDQLLTLESSSKWRIWYDDETTFDGDWKDAPVDGVLFVEDWTNNTKLVHMGSDYYLMREGTIMSFRTSDLHQHLILGIDAGALKFGRWTTNDVWQRVHAQVFPGETVGKGQFGANIHTEDDQ